MKHSVGTTSARLEQFFGLLMGVALGIILISLYPRWSPTEARIIEANRFDFLLVVAWLFGCAGLSICYFLDAKGKDPMAITGFGISALCFMWEGLAYGCDNFERCAIDRDDQIRSAQICLLVGCALLTYGKVKKNIPMLARRIVRAIAWLLVVLWLAALLYIIAEFGVGNAPILTGSRK